MTASGDGVEIRIGSAPHPPEEKRHIAFVYVETERGGQSKRLEIGKEPKLVFRFDDDKPIAVTLTATSTACGRPSCKKALREGGDFPPSSTFVG